MAESKSMTDHLNEVKTIAEHLEALEDPVAEKNLVMILISSLPNEYNNLITTLETLKQEKLTWDYVRDRVLAEFERKKSEKQQQQPKTPHDALFVGGSKGGGNSKFNRNESMNSNSFDKKTRFKCHYCKETGHFIKD